MLVLPDVLFMSHHGNATACCVVLLCKTVQSARAVFHLKAPREGSRTAGGSGWLRPLPDDPSCKYESCARTSRAGVLYSEPQEKNRDGPANPFQPRELVFSTLVNFAPSQLPGLLMT